MTDADEAGDTTTRRTLLTAVGTAATAAIAGCEETTSPQPDGNESGDTTTTTDPGPTPVLELVDVRVIQKTEESRAGAGIPIADAPIVAGEYASIMFDLNLQYDDQLPEIVPIAVTAAHADIGHSMQLHRRDAIAISEGADAEAVFHETAQNGPGDPPPVFRMPTTQNDIEVTPIHPDVDTNSVTLSEGPSGDFEVTTVPTLRVGFIEFKDPGDTSGRFHGHGHTVHHHTTDIDWGDTNGEAANYERSVASSMEYLRRAYPGKIVAYRHDTPDVGLVREYINNAATKDAERAMTALDNISSSTRFPSGGTIITEDHSRQAATDLMDASQGGGFDAHVVIVPKGTAAGNQDYFDAHWGSNPPVGYHYHYNAAVASEEALTGGDDVFHCHTTAQEIGHRFSANPYSDSTNRYARTGDFDNDGTQETDTSHAASNLVSTGYDLTDGDYALVNDYSITDGTWTNSGPSLSVGGAPELTQKISYMSYASGDHWPDPRIHRRLAVGNFQTAYQGGGTPDLAALPDHGGEVGPVLAISGSILDGGVTLDHVATYDATPTIEAYDPETHTDATPVTLRLTDPAGEILVQATVPDRHHGSHAKPPDGLGHSVAATLPFPADAVALAVDRDGVTTTHNPLVAPLEAAILDVAPHAFADGAATAAQFRDLLGTADRQVRDRDYAGAATTLREQFLPHVEAAITPYEAYASQPTPTALTALTERILARLDALADSDAQRQTVTVALDPTATYLHTNPDDPAADARPIALADHGFAPGDSLTLTRRGAYDKQGSGGQGLTAVFSASDTLLDAAEPHRLPDALDAGPDYETSRTYYGDEPTDIPEDFLVSTQDGTDPAVTVDIPADATHLFAAPIDNLYSDNTDADDDFRVALSH